MEAWRDKRLSPSLCEVDYEDAVQAALDKHGVTLVQVRVARRSRGAVLSARIEIATILKKMGVGARHTARLLNCDEWLARYYYNARMRERRRYKNRDRMRQKTSPHNHIERNTAAGPEVESVI